MPKYKVAIDLSSCDYIVDADTAEEAENTAAKEFVAEHTGTIDEGVNWWIGDTTEIREPSEGR